MSGRDEKDIHIEGVTGAQAMLVQRVAEEASERTCKRWFTMMGLDPDDPIAAQDGFASLRKIGDTEKRLRSLERWRWMHTVPAALCLALAAKLGIHLPTQG